MKKGKFFNLIGMGGISDSEPLIAKRWARRFDLALFPILIMALLSWYDHKHAQQMMSTSWHNTADWLLWLFFCAEMTTMLLLVKQRWRYLRYNWFNIVLIVVATPLLWDQQALSILRVSRFFLIFLKLTNLSTTVRTILSRNNLGFTILAVLVFVLFSGVMMATIEPDIHNIGDGIWWAWVTFTTVGYGDVVPVTSGGRILAGIVMLIGLGLLSLITANFSAFFIAREERKVIEKEKQVLQTEEKVLIDEQKILSHLQQIEQRLYTLEKKIGDIHEKQQPEEKP